MASRIAASLLTVSLLQSPDALSVGKIWRDGVVESDRRVRTDALDRLRIPKQPEARGKTFLLRVADSGPYSIESRSDWFDPYLVVRSPDGTVLGEDDDSGPGFDARVVVELQAGQTYQVQACAQDGDVGAFELVCLAGRPPAEEPDSEAELTAAERAVSVRGERFGADHPRTRHARWQKAALLTEHGHWKEAETILQSLIADAQGVERARVLFELGEALYVAGRYDEAEKAAAGAVEAWTGIAGPDHVYTAEALTLRGAALTRLGRSSESESVLRRSLGIVSAAFGQHDERITAALGNLSVAMGAQGRHADAEPLLRQCVAIVRETAGESASLAITLNNLAVNLKRQGRFEDAASYYQEAVAVSRRAIGPEHPTTAALLSNLGSVLTSLGRLDLAEPVLREGLRIRERTLGPDHDRTAVSRHSLAGLLGAAGRYEEAEQLYRRVAETFESRLGPRHPNTASALNNLATVLENQGRARDAEALHRRVLAIREKSLPPDHPLTALTLMNLGAIVADRKDYEEAESLLGRARAIFDRRGDVEHPTCLDALERIARVADLRGNRAKAIELFRQVLAARERVLGGDHPATALTLLSLALVLHEHGKSDAAEPLLRRALAVHLATFGEAHDKTVETLDYLARVVHGLGRHGEAVTLMRRACVNARSHLNLLFDAGASESDRLRYVDRYRKRLDILLTLATTPETDADALDAAYEVLVAWKGQVFRSMAWVKDRAFRAMTDRQLELWREFRAVQTRIAKLATGSNPRDLELLHQLADRRERLEADVVRAVGDRGSESLPNLPELAQLLPGNSVLVDFHVHRRFVWRELRDGSWKKATWGEFRVGAWILRPGTKHVVHVDVGPADTLRGMVERFLSSIKRERGLRPESDARDRAEADLRAALWEPLRAHVENAELILVSPDEFLATLSLETLRDRDGKHLIEKHAFVYLQDAAGLASLTEDVAPKAPPRFLGVGAIDYDLRAEAEIANSGGPRVAVRGLQSNAWLPLSETRREVDAIERLHKSAFPAAERRVLREDLATEEALKGALSHVDVLHLATHGFFDPARSEDALELPGLLSGLVCAGANLPVAKERDDGLLTAEEVAWLDLSACDLVVLSACQTGLGAARAGEGLMSLRRAFRQAGVRTVVSSLWKVRDDSTRELMVDFYERMWVHGQGLLVALRGAQLAMLARNRQRYDQSLPWTWGGFVMSGDWR